MRRRIFAFRVLNSNAGNKRRHIAICRFFDDVKYVMNSIDLSATNIYIKNDTRRNRDFYLASRQRVCTPTYYSGPMRLVWKVSTFHYLH